MTQATDTFAGYQGGLQTPVRRSFVITPDDVNELPFVTRVIYVGGSGDLKVRLADDAPGAQIVLKAVAVGTVLPLRIRQVYATGTTASLMVGTY
jgi:hypothetical protein